MASARSGLADADIGESNRLTYRLDWDSMAGALEQHFSLLAPIAFLAALSDGTSA